MHYGFPVVILGVAGKLLPLDGQIIPAADFRGNPHFSQGFRHRLHKATKIRPAARFLFNKGEIQIAQVVINRSAAGDAPHHMNAPPPDKVGINLRMRILKAAHNHRRFVLP